MGIRSQAAMVSTVLLVSAAGAASSSSALVPINSTSRLFVDDTNALLAGDDQDPCLGLPRNSVLASCPSPCLRDAPCIVYDQNAAHDKLTGCDFDTANDNSFCWSRPALSCEFHCFERNEQGFDFEIRHNQTLPERRLRAPDDPSLIEGYGDPYQSSDFVFAFGRLNLSSDVQSLRLAGVWESRNDTRVFNVDVDPGLMSLAPSVKSMFFVNLLLDSSRIAGVLAAAPPTLTEVLMSGGHLNTLTWELFETLPQLEVLSLDDNGIVNIAVTQHILPTLRELTLGLNSLTAFSLEAPNLTSLTLSNNQFVRIPECIFAYAHLEYLDITWNPIIRPLVLTAQQVAYLEALPTAVLELVDPPDQQIISRLPAGGGGNYGDYSDGVDLSELLEGAVETFLFGFENYPVRVVDNETATLYNDLLEVRARVRGVGVNKPNGTVVPVDMCQGAPRSTLLSNCARDCPVNGACVAYDQHYNIDLLSACDYDLASTPSFCTRANAQAVTCEFQCFPVYAPQSDFKFLIPFKTELSPVVSRQPRPSNSREFKTEQVPFLSNSWVTEIGELNLTSTVTTVLIAGGQSEDIAERLADVVVSSNLLVKAASVTSLSLLNIDLSKSDVASMVASASAALKSVKLVHTNLVTLPDGIFGGWRQLEVLSLAHNGLTAFDTGAIGLPALTNLDLSGNALTMIDIKAPKLKTLDLSGNRLDHIPLTVFSLSNLETLILGSNPIKFPLALSAAQVAFLNSVSDVQFGLEQLEPPLISAGDLLSAALSSGSAGTEVKGASVVIISNEAANQLNEQRKRAEQESMPAAGSSSADKDAGSSAEGSRHQGATSARSDAADSSSDQVASKQSPAPVLEDTTHSARSESLTKKLVFGGLGVAFIVAVVAVLLIIRKRRKSRPGDKASSYLVMTDTADGTSGVDTRGDGGKELQWWKDGVMLSHRLNAGDISDVRVLTSSALGSTWLVHYRSGSRKLVSKRLTLHHSEGAAYDAKVLQLHAEVRIASELRYPSILQLIGVAWTNKNDLQVLYECMSKGDLSSHLTSTPASTLPWLPEKLQIAISVVEALVYAHSFNPPLLHRDVRASNVLLDDEFHAKLGGFGSARPESENGTMTTREVGSGRWLAPEILQGSISYGTPSDIYSFGVVLCELDTHEVPYVDEAREASDVELLQRVAAGELRPRVSASCPTEIRAVAEACLASDPSERPTAMQVAYSLRCLQRHQQHEVQ